LSSRFDKQKVGDWHHFTEMVEYLDSIIGRVLKYVPRNTIIIFVSDNGSEIMVGGGKGTLLDLGCNVPLIVAGEGVVPGLDHSLIDLTDFHSTLAQLVDVSVEEEIHGQPFTPRIFGITGESRENVLIYMENKRDGIVWAVRNHRFKLYSNGSFFDLSIDHLERNPVPTEKIRKYYSSEYEALLEKSPPK
jgi:arylsulfatase A-like enzyme